jgi:hypothetical protein
MWLTRQHLECRFRVRDQRMSFRQHSHTSLVFPFVGHHLVAKAGSIVDAEISEAAAYKLIIIAIASRPVTIANAVLRAATPWRSNPVAWTQLLGRRGGNIQGWGRHELT